MAMIRCTECGKEISDRATSCPNCGCPVGSGNPNTNNSQYQQNNTFQQAPPIQPQPVRAYINKPSKNSGLGIAALILSILGFTFFIGIILAIIDLCRKDGNKKTFSIVSICICVFWVIMLVSVGGDDSEDRKDEISVESQSVIQGEADDGGDNEIIKNEEGNNNIDQKKNTEKQIDTKKEDSKISKDDFISSCEEIPYKTLARNPEENIGKHIKLTVKVSQIVQGGLFDNGEYYRVYTNDEYGLWLGDEYFMYDEREDKGTKILQDDVLTVYAECAGTTQVKRALTNTTEDVVSIKAVYIDLIEEEDYNGQTNSDSNDSEDDGLTTGQRNALNQAKSYLEWSAFSYNGLIDQLEYEQYSHEDAVFAVDNCGADWNEQAVEKAKSYLEFSSFSKDGLIEQLEYEGFTHEQAVYGAEQNGY